MSSENPDVNQDLTTLLVLLGPPGMNKKKWMRFIAESFPEKFHIIRIFTTRPIEMWEERPLYIHTPIKAFEKWRDLEGSNFFWGTYERQEGDNTFLYGLSHQDIADIPEEMCGILTLDSLVLFSQLQDAMEDYDFITIVCLRIIPLNITEENNVLVQNLKERGITDEREIKKRRKVAELLKKGTGEIADVTVYITGNMAADTRHIKRAINAI